VAKATPIRGLSGRALLDEAGPRILAARVRDVQKFEARLPEEEAVHGMRVAARRLRAALRLLRLRELDGKVKELQDALGAVRDLQLQIAWLRGRDDALAERRKASLKKAERVLERALSEWRARTLPRLLEAAESKFKGRLSGDHVRKVLRKRLARFEERLQAALDKPVPEAIHAVRRSVKQLRYLFELAQPAFPAAAKSLLVELTPLQESLGELHDVDVRLHLLRKKGLLREQKQDRARLAAIVIAELSRWKKQKIASSARKSLGHR
jgi:CHAD domain-containing protein